MSKVCLKNSNSKHKHIKLIPFFFKDAKPFTTTKSNFDEAMELLNSPGILFPEKNTHCHLRIFEIVNCKYGLWQPLNQQKILEQAKTCLLNQDWHNLTRLLIHLSSEKIRSCQTLDSLMQYVYLLVSHDPVAKQENFFNVFLENCCGCKTKQDRTTFLKRMLTIPKKEIPKLIRRTIRK